MRAMVLIMRWMAKVKSSCNRVRYPLADKDRFAVEQWPHLEWVRRYDWVPAARAIIQARCPQGTSTLDLERARVCYNERC